MKKNPLHSLHAAADAGVLRALEPNSATMAFANNGRRAGGSGSAGFARKGLGSDFRSDRASLAESEGKWEEGRERKGRRGQEMLSLHHRYESEEAKARMDGRSNHTSQQQQGDSSRLLTLPTMLTLVRVAAVPLLVRTYHMNDSWATTATTSIFLGAALTDWLDGYLARKMRLGTTFGAFLDPVADKLMVAATLVLLCTEPMEVSVLGETPWILTVPAIAIIGREITMSAVREWAASQDRKVLQAVAVNNLGKWKTATQMTALTILLITRDPSLTGPSFLVSTGVFVLYISAGLALWSLAVYMRKIWRLLLM